MDQTDEALQQAIAAVEKTGERRITPSGEGSMTWHVFGTRDPVVFLHGGMGSWMHWIRNIPGLARDVSLLIPDMPGHMDSAMPTPYTPEAVGAILVEGIDKILGPDRSYSVVGFSFGAAIAGQVARLGGSRVRSLVLVSPGGLGLRRGQIEGIERWRHVLHHLASGQELGDESGGREEKHRPADRRRPRVHGPRSTRFTATASTKMST